jgi:predicted RecB family nuclease
LPEVDRLARVRGVGPDLVPKLEVADVQSVEELAALTDLGTAAERSGLSKEKLDQLRHAATAYLKKEEQGLTLNPSSEDAGPEDGYAPSELLTGPAQVEGAA